MNDKKEVNYINFFLKIDDIKNFDMKNLSKQEIKTDLEKFLLSLFIENNIYELRNIDMFLKLMNENGDYQHKIIKGEYKIFLEEIEDIGMSDDLTEKICFMCEQKLINNYGLLTYFSLHLEEFIKKHNDNAFVFLNYISERKILKLLAKELKNITESNKMEEYNENIEYFFKLNDIK